MPIRAMPYSKTTTKKTLLTIRKSVGRYALSLTMQRWAIVNTASSIAYQRINHVGESAGCHPFLPDAFEMMPTIMKIP